MCSSLAQPGSEKCVARLLDFYISKLLSKPPPFYVRPLYKVLVDSEKRWYCRSRVGVNTLKSTLPQLSEEAGLDVRYTNYLLHATATQMYAKGVPEKLIAEKSGHKSLKVLHAYQQTSSVQEKAAGECIQLGKQ